MLFISPRNQISQNQRMLVNSDCRALFYGEELAPVAEPLEGSHARLSLHKAPGLDELLQTSDDTHQFPYDKTFDEARDEPCLVLHSSGSTGSNTSSECQEKN